MAPVEDIYHITGKFPKNEHYEIVSQMRRSAISVPSNIAEGAARNSNKVYVQFIYISLGSLPELETQVMIAQRLHFIDSGETVTDKITVIRQMLLNLVKHLRVTKRLTNPLTDRR